MIALLTSEARGDAARRAAAALDGYLPRVGRRTWLGAISAEGLADLRTALRKTASPATAVACHVVRGGKREELRWIVGRRDAFGPGGTVPVATSKKLPRPPDRSGMVPLLRPLVGLAACFHDLGKLSAAFQGILLMAVESGKAAPQPVRHELVSVLVLAGMLTESRATDDAGFLAALSDRETIGDLCLRAWTNLPKTAEPALTRADAGIGMRLDTFLPDVGRFPFTRGVAEIALNHHRLPYGIDDQGRVLVTDMEHTQRWSEEAMRKLPGHLRLNAAAVAELHGNWADAVASDSGRALAILRDNPVSDAGAWLAAVALVGRTALMLGDHYASSRKAPFPAHGLTARAMVAAQAFANTMSPQVAPEEPHPELAAMRPDRGRIRAAGPDSRVFADTWWLHTHKVRRAAIAALLALPVLRRELPHVEGDEMPRELRLSTPSGSPFAWQDDAAAAAGQAAAAVPDGALLVFLMAGTGRGKTLGAMKIVSIGRNRLRVSSGLGLRSLTLQTGDEYLGRLGLRPGQASTMIGSATAQALHVADAGSGELPDTDGTDAEDPVDADMAGGWDGGWTLPPVVERACEGNRRREILIGSPVLVSTIDMLMPVADARRGRHLAAALRVGTSDLVLDEIDSYEPEDAAAICRLVLIAAWCRRRVVVSSATLSPMLAEAVRAAYAAGRRLRAGLDGRSAAFAVGWFSEHGMATLIDDGGPGDTFSARHLTYASHIAEALTKAASPRHAVAIDLSGCGDLENVWRTVAAGCSALHATNRIVDPATGRGVSVGLVRWNRTRHARGFSEWTMQNGLPETRVSVLCFHARFPLAVRHMVDRLLREMLTRKASRGEGDPFLRHPRVRALLDDGDRGDVMILVASTPLLELGRDLDFDWGVVEPSSAQSAIQTAGRIRRHRPGGWAAANVGILSHAVDVLLGGWEPYLQKPGVETPIRMGSAGQKALWLDDRSSAGMFPMAEWASGLDAREAVLPSCPAALLAERRRAWCLLGHPDGAAPDHDAVAAALSVPAFAIPERMLDSMHPRERMFRRRTGITLRVFRRNEGWWARRDGVRNAENFSIDYNIRAPVVLKPEAWRRSLLRPSEFDPDECAAAVAGELVASGATLSHFVLEDLTSLEITLSGSREGTLKPIDWHSALGADYARGQD